MALQLKIIGVLLISLALFHIFFPKYFKWAEELRSLSLVNRQMMYVHSFFIALTVLLMGVVCICCTEDLLTTRLGHYLSFGFFIFWLLRFIFQLFVFSSKLWKDKAFETAIHIALSLLWSYLIVIFYIAFHRQ
jgi:hypothetical protein